MGNLDHDFLDHDFLDHVMMDGMWQLTWNDGEKVQNTRRTSADGRTENTAMLTVIRLLSPSKAISPKSQSHHALKTDLEAWQAITPVISSRP